MCLYYPLPNMMDMDTIILHGEAEQEESPVAEPASDISLCGTTTPQLS